MSAMGEMIEMTEDRELLALLCGELGSEERRRLERRLREDEALAGRYERLHATWESLELPPPPPLPRDFARRVRRGVERARQGEGEWAWRLAPMWTRWAAPAALAAGLTLGVGLGVVSASGDRTTGDWEAGIELTGPTLAESYWLSVTALEEDSP